MSLGTDLPTAARHRRAQSDLHLPRQRTSPDQPVDATDGPEDGWSVASLRHLWAAIVALVALRLALLPWTPPGFFRDEAAIHAHTKALIATGADANGQSWQLLSETLAGAYSSAVYLYPAALWGRIFGTGEASLRYFSQFLTIAAVVVLAAALRMWLGTRVALLAAVVALALPWGWLQGSIAWDNAMVPLVVLIGFWGFSVLLHSPAAGARRRLAACALPLGLVGSTYVYAPCRAFAPLAFLLMCGILLKRAAASRRELGAIVALACLSAAPMAHFLLQPGANSRTAQESVFHGVSVSTGIAHAVGNFWNMVNPAFLFMEGDPNLRHSTGQQGMLGLVSILPVLALISYLAMRYGGRSESDAPRPMDSRLLLIVVCACCAAFGFLGGALTATGQPHSLRSTAAWPFLAILLAVGWLLLLEKVNRRQAAAFAALFAVGTLFYAADLATGYRERAADWFDVSIRERIAAGEHVQQLDLVDTFYREDWSAK